MSIEAVGRGTSPPLRVDQLGDLVPELVGPSQYPIMGFVGPTLTFYK